MTATDFAPDFKPVGLEEALDTYAPEAQQEGFTVQDPDQAMWAARKLRQMRERLDEAQATAQREVDRIEAWLEEVARPLEAGMAHMEGLLTEYHRRKFKADPTAKTVKLPGVVLTARAQQPEWTWDDDAFVAWAKAHKRPDLVRRPKPVPDKVKAKAELTTTDTGAVVDANGVVVEGVKAMPRDPKHDVKVQP